jgi:hypothetical protein
MKKQDKPRVTNAQIKDAETVHIAWLNGASDERFTPEENRKFQIAADQGKLKWIVDGDKLVPVTDDDSDFFSDRAFNTPREAEHFTLGNEPGRSPIGKFAGSTFAPIYQHQITDKVRQETKSPTKDLVQDISRGGKFLLPIATQFLAKTPTGAAGLGFVGSAATGLGNRAASEARDEPYYGETLPNILATSAAVGASSAGNKYYSEEAVKNRQLARQIESQLGYPTRHWFWEKSPLDAQMTDEVAKKMAGGNDYTLGDWRNAPLDRFYESVGTRRLPMRMERLPLIFEPSKGPDAKGKYTTQPVKPASKNKGSAGWSKRQWDAVVRRFMEEAGIPDADPNDVRAFLEEAYFRPESKLGSIFYAPGGVPENFTTEEWAELRATENNPVTAELAAKQGRVIDPELDKKRAKALESRTERYQRLKGRSNKTKIVTPQQYDMMGSYDFKLPFIKFGKEPVRLPLRPFIRAGATTIPFAVQAVAPYAIKKITGGSDADE